MIGGFQDATKIPELRRRVLFTLGMLIVYRIGVFVPTPGIDSERLRGILEGASKTAFGLVDMFSGGALEHFSVFALGIMPYVSVSIIAQLLTTVIKSLEELSKEGEQGRRIITKYTRIGTVCLAMFQGIMISIGLESQHVVLTPGWGFRLSTAITLTAGTAFIMWLGEQVSERGIGNGVSLIIASGIVARMPVTLVRTFELMGEGIITPFAMLFVLCFAFLTIGVIVFVERSQRRIPMQYPRRAVGKGGMTQAVTQYLPLKINGAGVIPPIFASAFLAFPLMFVQFGNVPWLKDTLSYLGPGHWQHDLFYGGLIIFFAFFYNALVVDPNNIAENLKKQGGSIPTVRPGRDTAEFISRIVSRLTLWGALYLCVICIVPSMFYVRMGATGFNYFFGGTAVLIVVGVMMDTVSQIETHVLTRNYEGFISKGTGKVRGLGRATSIKGRLIQR